MGDRVGRIVDLHFAETVSRLACLCDRPQHVGWVIRVSDGGEAANFELPLLIPRRGADSAAERVDHGVNPRTRDGVAVWHDRACVDGGAEVGPLAFEETTAIVLITSPVDVVPAHRDRVAELGREAADAAAHIAASMRASGGAWTWIFEVPLSKPSVAPFLRASP